MPIKVTMSIFALDTLQSALHNANVGAQNIHKFLVFRTSKAKKRNLYRICLFFCLKKTTPAIYIPDAADWRSQPQTICISGVSTALVFFFTKLKKIVKKNPDIKCTVGFCYSKTKSICQTQVSIQRYIVKPKRSVLSRMLVWVQSNTVKRQTVLSNFEKHQVNISLISFISPIVHFVMRTESQSSLVVFHSFL